MTPLVTQGLAACAALAGAGWFVSGFRDLRVRRLVRDTPTARVRSMAMGLVELNGVCEARSQIAAPFSARPCAYWEVDISVPTPRQRQGWHVVHRTSSGHPFYLRDATGVALVQPHGARCRLPFGLEEVVPSLLQLPDLYRDFMASQGLAMRFLWQLGPMRFRERMLQDGQALYVLGRAFPRAQSVTLSDGELEESLAATGTDAWRARRVGTLDHEVQGVIRRASANDVLLLSPSSEKSVELEYAMRGWAGVVLGPLLTLGGIAVLLQVTRGG